MKKYLLIVIMCFALTSSYSQAGYMGKRLFVDYQLTYFPFNFEDFRFISFHKPGINYIISNQTVFKVNTELFNYKYLSKHYFGTNYEIGFDCYLFKRGHVAPVGYYNGLGFMVINSNLESVDSNDENQPYFSKVFGLNYTMGNSIVVKDKLMIKFGFSILFTPLIAFGGFDNNSVAREHYLFRAFIGTGWLF